MSPGSSVCDGSVPRSTGTICVSLSTGRWVDSLIPFSSPNASV